MQSILVILGKDYLHKVVILVYLIAAQN